ncbi:MAG: DegT/DnrJ/EryC1/StrS family aminotransferase [Candidatus Eremiobacteraeota bacterium]|nr:DegT/DnrJ/EryC1/StrS family aminotransferase [Candidatus Eremiobacteraeota bacterium]
MPERLPFVDLRMQYRNHADELQRAIDGVLESAAFILGPEVTAFEEEFARFIGARHCIGVGSGTAALRVALLALGIGPGDEVLMPANTYIACALATSQVGAVPKFVDVGDDYLMRVDEIESALTPKTKAIMPVHLYGQAADVEAIVSIARRHGLAVIEDASQAHGARILSRCVGSFADVGCFSFYPGKNLGAYGDGGAIVTNDPEVAERIRLYHDFGQSKKYEHLLKGDNCRLDSIQAAVLRVKLVHLERWNAQRLAAARRYDGLIKALGVAPPVRHADEGHVYHLYVIEVPDRDSLIERYREANIEVGIHYPVPIHLQRAYGDLQLPQGSFPRTEDAARRIISLPMFPEITPAQIERVAEVLKVHLERTGVRA